MIYEFINKNHLPEISQMYIEAFNAPPWNEKWTSEIVHKRLLQMMNCEGFIGLVSFTDRVISGMILGNVEYFYNSTHFNIKEFCVRLHLRETGIGTHLLNEHIIPTIKPSFLIKCFCFICTGCK